MAHRKQATKSSTPHDVAHGRAKPDLGDNALIEHDAILAEAKKVVRLWETADRSLGNADAVAMHVIVRAFTFDFFSGKANIPEWHKLEKAGKTNLQKVVLQDLFGIEKPTGADAQRLQRVKFAVPAAIKAGGLEAFSLTEKNEISVPINGELFKCCEIKVGAEELEHGRVTVSVSRIDKKVRKYLGVKAEKRSAGKSTEEKLKGASSQQLAKELDNRLAGVTADKLANGEAREYKHLLVALLGLFAATPDGKSLDTDEVQSIYTEAAA